jgi:cytochrome c oxidase cbb3-type subunit 3
MIPALLLAGTPDSATETALVITILLTILAVAITVFIVVLPEEERRRMGAALQRLQAYFVAGRVPKDLEFHHEFDGIRELDNRIPPWFSTLFLATILFAVVYMVDYHVLGSSPLMADEYRAELATADLERRILLAAEPPLDEATLVALKEPEPLQRGAEQFGKYCVSCHGAGGGGIVGPNLTDTYWIHGGTVRSVYAIIKNGVPAKGMIAWQLVLTPRQMHEVASYVLSLQGTNPPNGKKPEGEPFVQQADTATVRL